MLKYFHGLIGLRYAGSRQRGQLVSFISGLSIAGIAVGVALLLIVTSVMNGFERELEERILGIVPHGAIYHRHGIEDWSELREQINSHAQVVDSAPFVELTAMATRGQNVSPIVVYGIVPELEQRISVIDELDDSNWLAALNDGNRIALGSGLAKKLSLAEGDRVSLLIPDREGRNQLPKVHGFQVVGIIHTGTELDQSLAITSLESASSLVFETGRVSGIRLKTHDVFNAESTVYDVTRQLPYGFYGTSWIRTHGNLAHAIQMSKSMITLLLLLIIAIAAFNVVSTLVMVVIDKQGDIAILRSMGAGRGDITQIFLIYGGFIGGLGTSAGLLLGYLGAKYVADIVSWVERQIEHQFLSSDVYPIDYIPTQIVVADFIWVALIALGLCFAASLYPAWRASQVEPAKILNYE